jgi:WD40 repeat protein
LRRENFLSLAVSADGRRFAAGSTSGEIALWTLLAGAKIPGEFDFERTLTSAHRGWVQTLAFHPRRNQLASADRAGIIQLWDLDGKESRETLHNHLERVWSLAWSPDGNRLASAGADRVQIWPLDADRPRDVHVRDAPSVVLGTSFSPDGRELLSTHRNGRLRIWDVETRAQLDEFPDGEQAVAQACYSPAGARLAVLGDEGTLRVFPRDRGTEPRVVCATATAFGWLPGGSRLAYAVAGQGIEILNLDSGQVERRLPGRDEIRCLAATSDARSLVATSGQALRIWDLARGTVAFQRSGSFSGIAIAADDRLIAVRAGTNVELFEPARGFASSTVVLADFDVGPIALAGPTLAVGILAPPAVALWDVRTRQELVRLACDGRRLGTLAFSPDGRRLVAGGADAAGEGRIWEWSIAGP